MFWCLKFELICWFALSNLIDFLGKIDDFINKWEKFRDLSLFKLVQELIDNVFADLKTIFIVFESYILFHNLFKPLPSLLQSRDFGEEVRGVAVNDHICDTFNKFFVVFDSFDEFLQICVSFKEKFPFEGQEKAVAWVWEVLTTESILLWVIKVFDGLIFENLLESFLELIDSAQFVVSEDLVLVRILELFKVIAFFKFLQFLLVIKLNFCLYLVEFQFEFFLHF